MSSACYTNRIRTSAETRVNKVQYLGGQAYSYYQLQATCNTNPNYNQLNYIAVRCNLKSPCVSKYR